jgi:hypothetical protein
MHGVAYFLCGLQALPIFQDVCMVGKIAFFFLISDLTDIEEKTPIHHFVANDNKTF